MRTSLYSILCIVIRLGAVFLAFGMVGNVVNLVAGWYQDNSAVPAGEMGYTFGLVGLTLVVAIALWLYPGALARLAAGRSNQQGFESPIAASQFQWIALSVLGMYFVISGLIGLSGYGLNRALMSAYIGRTGDEGQRRMISDVLSWAIQIAFGLLLAIGAKGLSGALYRLRHGNAAPAEA